MKRWWRVAALLVLALVGSACTAGVNSTTAGSFNLKGPHKPVTLTLWETATGADLVRMNEGLKYFHKLYPWITLKVIGNVTDPSRILAAVHAGTVPDVWMYWTPQMPREYCLKGALMDLTPFIKRDHLDLSQFSPYWLKYMSAGGKQCSLPGVADAYGLYYNKKLLAAAGYTAPPKTLSQLEVMAKKLTTFNPDGSIKVAGFVPMQSFYDQWMPNFSIPFGAQWFNGAGKPALTTDPAWGQLLQWQKQFVGWYGYSKLNRFVSGLNNLNYTPQNAGETGKVAMWLDGEWRVAMIAADHAKVDYGTAPPPVPDNRAGTYGSGFIVSNTVAIPQGAPHPQEAWLLVKYLTTNQQWFASAVRTEKSVPATRSAISWAMRWAQKNDPPFQTFLKIYENPESTYINMDIGTCGCDMLNAVEGMDDKWVAGGYPSMRAALQQTQANVINQMSLSQG